MGVVKISELTEATLPLDGTEDMVIVQDAITKRVSTQDVGDLGREYKSYCAIINQSGTDAPVATIIHNSLGGTLVWARSSQGWYTATLAGVFDAAKTFVTVSLREGPTSSVGVFIQISCSRSTDDSITLTSSLLTPPSGNDLTDSLLFNYPFEVRVYN